MLKKAAISLGGGDALAFFLGVAPATVETWLNGSAPVPTSAFLACVDHLIDWDFAHVRDSRFGEGKEKR